MMAQKQQLPIRPHLCHSTVHRARRTLRPPTEAASFVRKDAEPKPRASPTKPFPCDREAGLKRIPAYLEVDQTWGSLHQILTLVRWTVLIDHRQSIRLNPSQKIWRVT